MTISDDEDRHADEGAGNAPQESPEEHGEHHREGRDGQGGAGNEGLQIVADQELDDPQPDENDDDALPRVQLGHGEQARKNGGDEGADERNVVEREGEQAPRGRGLDARKHGKAPDESVR